MSLRHRLFLFLRQFEDDCRSCLRRYNCASCRNREATLLLEALRRHGQAQQRPQEDRSVGGRVRSILAQLQGSERPLRSKELFLNCSKQLKEWTLRSMLKRGTIRRRRRTEYDYEYYIPKSHKENKPTEQDYGDVNENAGYGGGEGRARR